MPFRETRSRTALAVAVTAFACACATPTLAQFDASGISSLQTQGAGEVTRRVDRLRLTFVLEGRAETAKEAIARLEKRSDQALEKLRSLDPDAGTIKFGDIRVADQISEQRQQMIEAYQQQMAGRGREFKMPELAVFTRQVEAEWELPEADGVEFLLACHALAETIRKSDLSDSANPDPVSPAVEELFEELTQMAQEYGMRWGGTEEQSNAPQITYLIRCTQEEHAQAMSAAFADAKSKAEELAAAAGVGLGPLTALRVVNNVAETYEQYASFPHAGYGGPPAAAARPLEAVSKQPTNTTYRVTLQCAFRIE